VSCPSSKFNTVLWTLQGTRALAHMGAYVHELAYRSCTGCTLQGRGNVGLNIVI
jgi:hypothetical protein